MKTKEKLKEDDYAAKESYIIYAAKNQPTKKNLKKL